MDLIDPNPPNRRGSIDFHIDELILRGFAASDSHLIAATLERELSRLVTQGDLAHLPTNSMRLDHIDAGSFRLDTAAGPNHIGQTVAQRVYRHLSPTMNSAPAPIEGPDHA